jgi:F-type H+-transporting ATPase subunit b
MEEYLQFVSLEKWEMIFTWANLLILFLLLKKFLFKPINKILDERAAQIEDEYKAAEKTKTSAEKLKAEYEQRISNAQSEADSIIKSAVETANMRSDSIVDEASEKAKNIMEKSRKQIEADKKNAIAQAQNDIATMAVDVAEKLIEKKLNSEDDEQLILQIIENM